MKIQSEGAGSTLRFLFRKGTIDILLFLHKNGEARYSEISKRRFVSSRETLSRRLRELEDLKLIIRDVKSTRPPMTVYYLSKLGKQLVSLLFSISEILSKSKSGVKNNE